MTSRKELKTASKNGGGFVVENKEIIQEIKEIKKLQKQTNTDVREIKNVLNNNREKNVSILEKGKKESKKKDIKIINLEVQEDKLVAQLSDGRGAIIPIE
jgi:uncharacterized coiled-coil DUF342 family protein